MGEGFRIRPGTRADRATLLAFHRALYVDYRSDLLGEKLHELYAYKDLDRALAEDVDAILANPKSCVLLAEDDRGSAIGYITGHTTFDGRRVLSTKGVVEDWFVHPHARRHGVGKALLETLEAIFREAKCTVIESATFPLNRLARSAHERMGFEEIEVRYRKKL